MTYAAKIEAVAWALVQKITAGPDGQTLDYNYCVGLARTAIAALEAIDGWRGIAEAKKDGKPILIKLKSPIPRILERDRPWDGLVFVGRHPGLSDDGFDIGWNFAAPVGMGGFPDDWIEGWREIP